MRLPVVVRVVLVIATVALAEFAVFNVLAWHHYGWIAVAVGAAVALGYGVFEIRRYRPRVDGSATWETTGERFIDPTTREDVVVYYDPVSGQRDYRTH